MPEEEKTLKDEPKTETAEEQVAREEREKAELATQIEAGGYGGKRG